MKIKKEQLENLGYEDIRKMIMSAVERGDKEFIMSVIPLYWEYCVDNSDYINEEFMELFEDSNLFEDREIALELAKNGYIVPKDLYENDEEIILETIKAGSMYEGMDLASDDLRKNKDFVIRMISMVNDYILLKEILNGDPAIPEIVLENDEIEQFVTTRIQEFKEKEESHEEPKPLEDMTLEELQKTEQDNDERIGDNNEAIRQALIQRIREQQKIIAAQETEINELKSQKKEL